MNIRQKVTKICFGELEFLLFLFLLIIIQDLILVFLPLLLIWVKTFISFDYIDTLSLNEIRTGASNHASKTFLGAPYSR